MSIKKILVASGGRLHNSPEDYAGQNPLGTGNGCKKQLRYLTPEIFLTPEQLQTSARYDQ